MIFDPNGLVLWILIISILVLAVAIISRPFSTYVKFVYPNAKFEAMGNPFILESELTKLLENKDLEGFKEKLNQTKDYKISGNSIKDIQKSLDEIFVKTVDMMKKDSSKKMNMFYDTYLEKIDSYLIKYAIKHKIQDKKVEKEIIDNAFLSKTKKLLDDINSSDKKELANILIEYGYGKEIINIISENDIDFLRLDTEIDRHIVNKFREIKVPYKCNEAKKIFIDTYIDTNNINYILRAKQLNYDPEPIKQFSLGEGREIAKWKYNELSQLESIPQVISSLEGTSYFEPLKNSIETFHKEKSVQIFEMNSKIIF